MSYQITLYNEGKEKETFKAKNLYHLKNLIFAGFIIGDEEGKVADKVVIEDDSNE